MRRYDWRAHATRVGENVLDLSHFPWVHPGLLGDRSQPIGPDIAVESDGDELCYDVPHELTGQVRRYRLNLPFTVRIVRQPADPAVPDRRTLFLTHTPVADKQTLQFQVLARNFGLDEPDDDFRTLNATIVAQDEPIVASQRPELLPTDLSAELHLRGPDATAIEYRRALARLGI